MFEELILVFKSWDFSLKQPETIRAYKLLFLMPIPQGKEQEEAKPVAGFQNVFSSGVHEFPFGRSVHFVLKCLLFCVSRAISDASFRKG